ncbi:MAG: hypothetical protein OEY21_10050, partial [Nitrospira sp.]|nr:hypothetical protein [Nitrospira sp.]
FISRSAHRELNIFEFSSRVSFGWSFPVGCICRRDNGSAAAHHLPVTTTTKQTFLDELPVLTFGPSQCAAKPVQQRANVFWKK